jgi:hypothetical protein
MPAIGIGLEVSRTWDSFLVHDVTLIKLKTLLPVILNMYKKKLVDAIKPVINKLRGIQGTRHRQPTVPVSVRSSLRRRHDSSYPHALGLHVTQEHLGQLLVGSIPFLDPPNTVVVDTDVLIVARLSLRS